MTSTNPTRPIGVTILAILAFATAAFAAYSGAMIIAGGAGFTALPMVGGIFAGLIIAIAGVVFFIALIWALVGWGYLTGKGWARTIGLIFAFLGLLFGLASVAGGQWIAIISLLTGGLTIFYLFTGPVKAFFGNPSAANPSYANPTSKKSSFSPASFASPSIGTSSTGSWGKSQSGSSHSSNTARFCNNCGATVSSGQTKCSSCGTSL